MVEAARAARPALVVVAVEVVEAARAHAPEIRSLAAEAPLALGGSVPPEDARLFDARVLDGDPLEAARAVADSVGVPGPHSDRLAR